MLEKKAILKFSGQDVSFSLEEIDEMYVPEFEWWIRRLGRHYEEKNKQIQESNNQSNQRVR